MKKLYRLQQEGDVRFVYREVAEQGDLFEMVEMEETPLGFEGKGVFAQSLQSLTGAWLHKALKAENPKEIKLCEDINALVSNPLLLNPFLFLKGVFDYEVTQSLNGDLKMQLTYQGTEDDEENETRHNEIMKGVQFVVTQEDGVTALEYFYGGMPATRGDIYKVYRSRGEDLMIGWDQHQRDVLEINQGAPDRTRTEINRLTGQEMVLQTADRVGDAVNNTLAWANSLRKEQEQELATAM